MIFLDYIIVHWHILKKKTARSLCAGMEQKWRKHINRDRRLHFYLSKICLLWENILKKFMRWDFDLQCLHGTMIINMHVVHPLIRAED